MDRVTSYPGGKRRRDGSMNRPPLSLGRSRRTPRRKDRNPEWNEFYKWLRSDRRRTAGKSRTGLQARSRNAPADDERAWRPVLHGDDSHSHSPLSSLESSPKRRTIRDAENPPDPRACALLCRCLVPARRRDAPCLQRRLLEGRRCMGTDGCEGVEDFGDRRQPRVRDPRWFKV